MIQCDIALKDKVSRKSGMNKGTHRKCYRMEVTPGEGIGHFMHLFEEPKRKVRISLAKFAVNYAIY